MSASRVVVLLVCLLATFSSIVGRFVRNTADGDDVVRLCVPELNIGACQKLAENTGGVVCVSGRDRMQCLDKVKRRMADLIFVDPEDMYVAYHLENEDFDIVSEVRTVEEQNAPFRYEGIILVRRNSDIHQISDLKGVKSCHTGFGRNVGYKIPVTKLKKHGVFKVSADPDLSSVEKELKGLSELFEKSCLVGKYSADAVVDSVFKKHYSNLCAMCENPDRCDYPDKYSGYEGAIRCLVENNGDVAFTKVIFVKKYFGLPIGNETTTPKSNVNEYEYLCEDGTRRPLTGQACSWAQRPWQGFMSNADVFSNKRSIQDKISRFFEAGKTKISAHQAAKLGIKDILTVYPVPGRIQPGDHLFKAQYKDVIERDGTEQGKVRLCVSSEVELKKCIVMKKAAYSRDVRPEFDCLMKIFEECQTAVAEGKADAVVLPPRFQRQATQLGLLQLLREDYGVNNTYVAVVDENADEQSLKRLSLKFDASKSRAIEAALFYNAKREKKICPADLKSDEDGQVELLPYEEARKLHGKRLVCDDFSTRSLEDFRKCNFEYSQPNGIFVGQKSSRYDRINIQHAFVSLADTFGPQGNIPDVFTLFGEFETGQKDIIFHDDTVAFSSGTSSIDLTYYFNFQC